MIPASEVTATAIPKDRRYDAVAVVAIVLQVALSIHFAATASPTHDEYWHLPVGSLHWRTGRFDLEPLNPPLLRLWSGLPVAFFDRTPLPEGPLPPGEYGDRFVAANPETFQRLYFAGRLMIILMTAATSVLIAAWARSWYGPAAGATAAITWGLSPTTISHGSLVTTDMAAALAFVAVLWSLWRFAERPTWTRALVWGAAIGAAQATKYTCVLLYPLSFLGWWFVQRPSASRPRPARIATQVLVAGVLSLVVLNTAYLFEHSFRPLSSFAFRSQAMKTIQNLLGPMSALPLPVPAAFLTGLDEQRIVMEQQHPVFLDGRWSLTGFHDYYIKAIAYKTPLGTLALLGLAAVLLILRRLERRQVLFWLIPASLLTALASSEGMQLGVRYVLPSLALLTLAATSVVASPQRAVRGVGCLCAAASLAGLWSHPYELASFNTLAGGPDGGRYHLVDSNLDWGQDLGTLAAYMRKEKIDDIALAYFGTVDPGALGIRFHEPPPKPTPGLYAISVNFVMGRPHVILDGAGGARAVNIEEFGYFRFYEPIARLGHSIDVYRLTEADIAEWQRVMRGR